MDRYTELKSEIDSLKKENADLKKKLHDMRQALVMEAVEDWLSDDEE